MSQFKGTMPYRNGVRLTCARCDQPAHWIRQGCRPLCGHHLANCSACGRARDTRHPNKTELCRDCYNQALKALQGLLNDPESRGHLLEALQHADTVLNQAHNDNERKRQGAHGPIGPEYKKHLEARAQLADLAIALGGRP
jgi:hypothetical protein